MIFLSVWSPRQSPLKGLGLMRISLELFFSKCRKITSYQQPVISMDCNHGNLILCGADMRLPLMVLD